MAVLCIDVTFEINCKNPYFNVIMDKVSECLLLSLAGQGRPILNKNPSHTQIIHSLKCIPDNTVYIVILMKSLRSLFT